MSELESDNNPVISATPRSAEPLTIPQAFDLGVLKGEQEATDHIISIIELHRTQYATGNRSSAVLLALANAIRGGQHTQSTGENHE